MDTVKAETVHYYTAYNGKQPFLEWFKNIRDPIARSRVRRRLDRMELGNYGDYKVLAPSLCELRLDFGLGFRIYFTEQGADIVMLLVGGDKSTQSRDIEAAKAYLEELKERVYHG